MSDKAITPRSATASLLAELKFGDGNARDHYFQMVDVMMLLDVRLREIEAHLALPERSLDDLNKSPL